MTSSFARPGSTARPAFHRLVSLVVLALQVSIAVSPVWEERPGVRLGVHTEEQGAPQHAAEHTEESCVVCAARAQTQAPPSPMPEIAFESPVLAPLARAEYAASDIRGVTTRSRAPPITSN